jgi:hypothetical protein
MLRTELLRIKSIGISVALGLLLSGTSAAQHNPEMSSIDLRVAQADRVVVGRISSMGEATGSAELNTRHQSIVLAVEQTLKGEPVDRLPLDVDGDLWRRLDQGKVLCGTCAERTHHLLVTVGHWQDYPQIVDVIDLDDSSVIDVSGDLRLLRTGADILQSARDEVIRCPGRLDDKQVFHWGPSDTFMAGTPFHGYTIYVPIDERQEQVAHEVLGSQSAPAGIGSGSVDWYANDRPNSVLALAFFRSEQNIRLLRSLLNDPEIEHLGMGQLDYPVRAAAYKVLSQWGVDAPKPVTIVKIQEPPRE